MRLLHIINSLTMGGAERLLKDAVNEMCTAKPGIEQHLITLYEDGLLRSQLNPAIKYSSLKATKSSFFLKVFALRRYIKKHKIDVVHAHLYDAMIIARLATPAKVRLVNTYHSSMYNRTSDEYSLRRKMVDRITGFKPDHTVFVSETVKKDITGKIRVREPFTIVPNFPSPIFKSCYSLKNRKELWLVSVGNLRIPKNYGHSIAVLECLKDYDISLDIYGFGPMEDELKKRIHGTGARVQIITDRQVDAKILGAYDLFFMSSLQEGMSVALVEALAAGLPAVLSDIPSLRETAGNAAFFFRLGSADSAANTLLHLYRNRDILHILSENAKKVSAQYSIENYLQALFKIYFGRETV